MSRLTLGVLALSGLIGVGYLVWPESTAPSKTQTVSTPAPDASAPAPDRGVTRPDPVAAKPLKPLMKPLQLAPTDPFVGPEACRSCHTAIYDAHLRTAHQGATAPVPALDQPWPLAQYGQVRGAFAKTPGGSPEGATFPLPGIERSIQMYTADGDRRQRVMEGGQVILDQPFDMSIGSGKMAQNFAEWKTEDVPEGYGMIVRLAIHYATGVADWTLTPGEQGGRGITVPVVVPPRCMHCHATHHEVIRRPMRDVTLYAYKRDSLMLGITCEACHGPGRRHVEHHQQHPEAKEGAHIINVKGMPRDRQIDACGLCHNGVGEEVGQGIAGFKPGGVLSEHLRFDDADLAQATTHASQVNYLQRSACFQKSPEMTCSTCHDVHRHERDAHAPFEARCKSCHGEDKGCSDTTRHTTGCVDCHMPRQVASDITVKTREGTQATIPIRTHHITRRPEKAVPP
ncbi:MAG: hypothetical protein ACE366_20835 [Bradymonadia bacterium]